MAIAEESTELGYYLAQVKRMVHTMIEGEVAKILYDTWWTIYASK